MNLSKLTRADRLIVLSALVFFVATFLDWFTADIAGDMMGELDVNGWETEGAEFWVWLPFLLSLAMVAVVVIRRFSPQTRLPELAMGWGQILFFAGVLAAGLVLMKLLLGEDVPDVPGVDIDVSRSLGIFIGLLAAAGLALGGYLEWQEEKKGGGGSSAPTPF
ncbi:MAG TPA: hypothetical protein VIL48_12630 [Acidimicrobiales bacterium]